MKVQPIKDEKKIKTIKKMLYENPRNHLIFVMGLNTGLRMGDLLKLKISDVVGKKLGDKVDVKEQKTGKYNYFIINKEIDNSLRRYLDNAHYEESDFLFQSRKGNNRRLLVESVNHLIKKWCFDVGLKGNYGCHSLRKTFGYVLRFKHGIDIEVLMKRFNHSSQSITLKYIGLEDKQVNDCLMISV